MVAFNTWGGEALCRAALDAPGVVAFTVLLPDTAALKAIRLRLDRAGVPVAAEDAALTCDDPEGNRVRLTVRTV